MANVSNMTYLEVRDSIMYALAHQDYVLLEELKESVWYEDELAEIKANTKGLEIED